MSVDFVSDFVQKYGIDLSDRSFLDDRKVVETFFEAVLASRGKAITASIDGRTMTIVGDGIALETTLHTALIEFSHEATSVADLTILLERVGEAFINNMQPSYDRKAIWLAFMNKAQVDEMSSDFAHRPDGSARSDEDMPIFYRQTAELHVSPVIAVDAGLVPVTERICRSLGVQRNDLFEIGLENLTAALAEGRLEVQEQSDGSFAVHSVLPPASGLFLLSSFWKDQEKKLGSTPIIRIIHGDTVVFGASKTSGRMSSMFYRTKEGVLVNPISDDLFVWQGDTFVKHRNAA